MPSAFLYVMSSYSFTRLPLDRHDSPRCVSAMNESSAASPRRLGCSRCGLCPAPGISAKRRIRNRGGEIARRCPRTSRPLRPPSAAPACDSSASRCPRYGCTPVPMPRRLAARPCDRIAQPQRTQRVRDRRPASVAARRGRACAPSGRRSARCPPRTPSARESVVGAHARLASCCGRLQGPPTRSRATSAARARGCVSAKYSANRPPIE